MNKNSKKALKDAATFAFIIAAGAEVMTALPSVTIYSDRLDRYQDGQVIKPSSPSSENECLVAEEGKSVEFIFNRSTSVSLFQHMLAKDVAAESLGTLPAYTTVNINCEKIKDDVQKWDSVEHYLQENEKAYQQIQTNLKREANEPQTTRFSTVKRLAR